MMNAEPHAMHRWLQQLVGDWTSTSGCETAPDQPDGPSLGAEHVRALGELWVILEGTGTLPGGGEARMQMTLGYDPETTGFLGTWVGSMMTHMWVYRGTLDADELNRDVARSRGSDDIREGAKAWAEKRAPRFVGR